MGSWIGGGVSGLKRGMRSWHDCEELKKLREKPKFSEIAEP